MSAESTCTLQRAADYSQFTFRHAAAFLKNSGGKMPIAFWFSAAYFHMPLDVVISFAAGLPHFKQENHLSLAFPCFNRVWCFSTRAAHWKPLEALIKTRMPVSSSRDNDVIGLNWGLGVEVPLIKMIFCK